MRTTIFITDNEIKIIRARLAAHKLKIKRAITLPLNSEIIKDGLIKNEEEFMKILYSLKKASPELFKNITLVLDSRHTITKKIDIPKLTKKQIESIVYNEMNDLSESYGELIYDYSLFNNKKILLCCALQKNIIDDYKKNFHSPGIRFKKIDIGINSVIKLTQNLKVFNGKTFVINIIHADNILSLLFENNNYIISTRLKINEPKESEKYIEDIYNKLSTLIQFNKAQKSEFEINYSYYCGLEQNEIDKLKSINVYKNINISNLKDFFSTNTNHNPSDFIFNISALLESKKDINLLETKKIYTIKSKNQINFSIYPIVVILMITIAAMYYLILYRDTQNINDELNEANLYVNDEANNILYADAQKTLMLLANTQNSLDTIKKFQDNTSSIAVLNSDKINKIFIACEENVSISALSFTAKNNLLNLEANAINSFDITNFILRLKSSGIFSNIVYSGYKMDSTTQIYKFNVNCYLKVGDSDE